MLLPFEKRYLKAPNQQENKTSIFPGDTEYIDQHDALSKAYAEIKQQNYKE